MTEQGSSTGTTSAGTGTTVPLRAVAAVFLRLGFTAFGGPAAHVALMDDEVVRRRGWLTHPEFLDLLGATNLIPGPNSTEMAIHIGYRVAGWKGFAVAGMCFILPAALMGQAGPDRGRRPGARPAAPGGEPRLPDTLRKSCSRFIGGKYVGPLLMHQRFRC